MGGTIKGLEGGRKGETRIFLSFSSLIDSSCISVAPASSGVLPAVAVVPFKDPQCLGSGTATLLPLFFLVRMEMTSCSC